MSDDVKLNSIDSVLNASLEELCDMEVFTPFPVGQLLVVINIEDKEVNDRPAFEVTLKYRDVIELADETAEVPELNAENTSLYFMDSRNGQGSFKQLLNNLMTSKGVTYSSVSELIADVNGDEVAVTITHRKAKKVKGQKESDRKVYISIDNVAYV